MAAPLLSFVDHLVLVTPDLQQGIDGVAGLLGVTAAVGGKHPKWRTQNALLSLGPRLYLELMASDGEPADPANPRPFGIDGLSSMRLATWVARADDLQRIVSAANSQGVDLGPVQPGSRRKPDGTELRWEMTDLTKNRENGIVPYFINWGATVHPGMTSPQGCRLEELKAFHPEPQRIMTILSTLGIDLRVEEGPARLEIVVQSPKGRGILK